MACTALYSVGAGVGDKQDVGRRRSGSSVKARYLVAKLMENEAQYCALRRGEHVVRLFEGSSASGAGWVAMGAHPSGGW